VSTRAAVLNSRCPRYLPTSPRWENWRGFLLHPSDCVLPHVNLLGSECSQSLARYFSPRLLFGVEVVKKVFNALFAAALILGLASTLAANAQHGTAPQLVTSNYFGVRPTACVPDGAC